MAILAFGCNNKEPLHQAQAIRSNEDTLRFKKWLRDTVGYLGKSNETLIVEPDSTFMDLKKKYNVEIVPGHPINNIEIESAIWLLEMNDTVPAGKFNLSFEVNYFYQVGFKGMSHTWEREFEDFVVKTPSRETNYNFVKSNMTNKKVTDL